MVKRISIIEYLSQQSTLPLIDVRTPAEYQTGHVPIANNIPLFSNEERAEVGTVYKQVSHEKAYDLGYKFVAPKLDYYVDASKKVAVEGKVAVYCWRGGMRSKSFAEHIEKNGVKEVYVIEGGYKAFRQHALEAFAKPDEILVLGGYTGSGKTRILKQLMERDEQVIDLEGIANHKGSAFGAIGEDEQPVNEHFTNLLFWQWKDLDMTRRVWLEDESIHIGKVYIPEALFQRMRDAFVYFLNIPKEERAHLLMEEYPGTDKEALIESVQKISKRLGGLRTREALDALEANDFYNAAIITLDYYDKYYLKGLLRRPKEKVLVIESETADARENALRVLGRVGD